MNFENILLPTQNNVKFYLGKVTEIDEKYLIKFKIPGILENGVDTFPTAYPCTGQHIQEIVEDDTVLIIQLDDSRYFFMYTPINLSDFTGIFFKDVKIDISDGKIIDITTKSCKGKFDGENDLIELETDSGLKVSMDGKGDKIKVESKQYSLGKFIEDLDKALQSLHTEGSPYTHTANSWYSSMVKSFMSLAQKLFPSS